MKKSSIQCVALLAAAGLACSMAAAQTSDAAPGPASSKARAGQSKYRVVPNRAEATPIKVEVNGVEVPFALGSGAGDSNFVLYDNITLVGPLVTGPTHNHKALDDFTFAGSQVALITGLRPSFATPAAVTYVGNVVVEYQFFGTFNSAASPVNSGPSSNIIRITYGAPAAGWAVNTAYTGSAFSLNVGGGSGPTVSSGAVEVKVLTAAFVAHPEFDPTIDQGGVVAGGSTDGVWVDTNTNGQYESGETLNLASASDNLRLQIQGQFIETAAGACCLPGGSCVVLTNAQCTGLSGTYNGDGSTCASVAGHCATPPVLHNNGPMITGPNTLSGVAAPAGGVWSEGVQEGTCTTTINGPNGSGTFRLADDIEVPSGKQWALNKVSVYAYNSPGNTATTTVTSATLQIWNGPPNNPSSSVVWGNPTTNVLAGSSFTNIYRQFNTAILAQPIATTRPIWKFDLNTNASLPAGKYWLDFNFGQASFTPQITLMTNLGNGVRNAPAANALQFLATATVPNTGSGWQLIGESGGQAGCLAQHYDLPFIVEGVESNVGGGPVCYPNCDNSTVTPCLNVGDFSCFLNSFANGNSYANCDGSTTTPVLNVGDFSCFLNAFANGCSACI